MKNLFFVILALALVIGGLLIIGVAFAVPGLQRPIFFGGIISITLWFFIPIVVLPHAD